MNFEDEIKKGNFVISECKSCNKIIWPPNDICNSCFGITKWRKASKNGKILEYSKNEEQFFCLVELEQDLRVICTLIDTIEPKIDQEVSMTNCSMYDGKYSFEVKLSQ